MARVQILTEREMYKLEVLAHLEDKLREIDERNDPGGKLRKVLAAHNLKWSY